MVEFSFDPTAFVKTFSPFGEISWENETDGGESPEIPSHFSPSDGSETVQFSIPNGGISLIDRKKI